MCLANNIHKVWKFHRLREWKYSKKYFTLIFLEITTNGTKNNRNKCILLQMNKGDLNLSPLDATLF
jgi:hypothetical protein